MLLAPIFGFLLICAAPAESSEKGVFPSFYAENDVALTADSDTPFWKNISGVVMDKSMLGPDMPEFRAEIRSRWTKEHVYFLFIGKYEKLTLKSDPDTEKETYRLWMKDCFEVYLGADPEKPNRYGEFQMSPQGEFLDLDIDSTKPRPGFNGEQKWDSGMKVKARIDEKKKIWYGEMCIPIKAVDSRPAEVGREMKINLFRQDGEGKNRVFLGWQPTGVWNPHHPDKFGILRFVKEEEKGSRK